VGFAHHRFSQTRKRTTEYTKYTNGREGSSDKRNSSQNEGMASPTKIKHARAISRKERKERREIAICFYFRNFRGIRG
jgi:hypothetical protein